MSRYITTISDPVPQGTTPTLRAQLVDESGANQSKAALTSAVWSLYHPAVGVINSRDSVDCMGSISAEGLLALTLAAADTAIINEGNAKEKRVILLEWETASRVARHEIHFHVANLGMVP